jgi:protease I
MKPFSIFWLGFAAIVGSTTVCFAAGATSTAPSNTLANTLAKKVLIPIPHSDFDPTEAAVPWQILKTAGDRIVFATPDGQKASADPAELSGDGLGLFSDLLRADKNGRDAYTQLEASEEFNHPLSWSQVKVEDFDAIYLPGGHSPGMQPYLRSEVLQHLIAGFFSADKPVGAICHGALLVARSNAANGKSVLYGRKTTSLTTSLEMTGYEVTKLTGGRDYQHFRTDPVTVEDQIKGVLASPSDYEEGPLSIFRDSPSELSRGFYVEDRNYISARWPGDAFRFGNELAHLIATYQPAKK